MARTHASRFLLLLPLFCRCWCCDGYGNVPMCGRIMGVVVVIFLRSTTQSI